MKNKEDIEQLLKEFKERGGFVEKIPYVAPVDHGPKPLKIRGRRSTKGKYS